MSPYNAKRTYYWLPYTKREFISKYGFPKPCDGEAFKELSHVLDAQGLHYGGTIFNFPPEDPNDLSIKDIDDQIPPLRRGDVIVTTTRLPMDRLEITPDGKVADKYLPDEGPTKERYERVAPGQTSLEARIFLKMHDYFVRTRRDRVQLSPELIEQLHEDDKFRGNIAFGVQGHKRKGRYGKMYYRKAPRNAPRGKKLTAAYLVYDPEIWQGGPGLLASFGITGHLTYIFNYLVRTRFANLLRQPIFIMAEINTQTIPQRPTSLAFCEDWDVRLVLPRPMEVIRLLSDQIDAAHGRSASEGHVALTHGDGFLPEPAL